MATAQTERNATAVWNGDLLSGNGTVSGGTGALGALPVTWPARTQSADGKTSPEELVAAAHAACYAMAFSHHLASSGTPPEHLEVTATVGLDPKESGGVEVTYSRLNVIGTVAGLDQDGFQAAAEEGEKGCPISNLIRGNAEITVTATLGG